MDKEKLLGENGYKYKEQYGIIVVCESEEQQQQTYEELLKKGYKLKVVCV